MRKSAARPPEKKSRNPERTRLRLLTVATTVFSKHGYDGVSVDQIVAAARLNKRMVYHYFTNKEGLYAEVLRSVFERLTRLELKTFDQSDNPADSVRNILQAYFQFLEENPEFVSLLSWENLHHGRFIAKHPDLLSKSPVLERLQTVIQNGVEQGVFRSGINIKHLLVSMISLCFVYHANRFTLSQSVGLDLHSPKVLAQGLQHAIDLVLNGLLYRR